PGPHHDTLARPQRDSGERRPGTTRPVPFPLDRIGFVHPMIACPWPGSNPATRGPRGRGPEGSPRGDASLAPTSRLGPTAVSTDDFGFDSRGRDHGGGSVLRGGCPVYLHRG